MLLLEKRLALITGAGGGLGTAIAHGLAEQGARLIITDIDGQRARKTAEQLTASGVQAVSAELDVTDRAAVDAFSVRVGREYGDIDILINNAGVSGRVRFDEPQSPETWDRVISINLQGTFNVSYAFVEALKRMRGTIINLASLASFVATPSTAAYVASKGAVRSLTQALAREFGVYGIRVNAIAPGVMETDMTADLRSKPESIAWYMNRTPMARCGSPKEVIGPVVFLASDMASYVNGIVLPIDGGFLAV